MPAMTCPQCASEMAPRERAGVSVAQCTSCAGLFLRRLDRGVLIEAENDWHLSSGPSTQPIPRITTGMAAPTMTLETPHARSFVDELFG
ncbi:MAG: zf-TFIIB domain-containing protein [Nocardioidaceae bacterium]